MRLSDCILCVMIYYNVPGLLHRNAGNARFHGNAGNVTARRCRGRRAGGAGCRKLLLLFALLRRRKNKLLNQKFQCISVGTSLVPGMRLPTAM